MNAVLALSKFMCVNFKFCDQHLQLLFTLLEQSPDPDARANIIVALGGLSFALPFSSLRCCSEDSSHGVRGLFS